MEKRNPQKSKSTDFKSSKSKSSDFKSPKTKSADIKSPVTSIISSSFKNEKLDRPAQYILENFDQIIQGVRPLNSRQLQQLPDNIRSLSHQLTDQRSTRRLGYMNDNVQLSSYVRYYTWWNLVRLTRLFSNLPDGAFPNHDDSTVCLDLGSGPLTVVTALWLARPELRARKLVWYCLDVSANSMALGEDIYLSVVARTQGDDADGHFEPWKIIRVKGSFGTQIRQKADLITCANMLNELDQASDMPPEFQSKKYYDQLEKYAAPYARVLLVEPGVPKAARTLSLLRERFIRDNFHVLAPCPHALECPMNGFKAYTGSQHKWCNFAFTTEDAPAHLQKLSVQAKLPKERATLSFLCVNGDARDDKTAGGKSAVNGKSPAGGATLTCRITSDAFRLPGNNTGFYACSELGLTLVKTGDKNCAIKSGDLIQVKIKTPDLPKDEKSGACIISV